MAILKKFICFKDRLQIAINRRRGKEYIPNNKEILYIETSSLCNLACKFCAYIKKEGAKGIMSNPFFFSVIGQAVDCGFDTFGLTPLTGELFMDKEIFRKFQYLEEHPRVKGFHFFTNFTLLDENSIIQLLRLKKLVKFSISIYGHDERSFLKITGARSPVYKQLVSNLKILCQFLTLAKIRVSISWRTEKNFYPKKYSSELVDAIRTLHEKRKIPVSLRKSYNNWGGLITAGDVDGLNMDVADGRNIYKNGACSLIFYKLEVLSDGRVNACACRDVNATLCIGDLKKQSLKEILSLDNKKYLQLIENQQKGKFNAICRGCDFYRSIYKNYRVYRHHRKKRMNLEQFYSSMRC